MKQLKSLLRAILTEDMNLFKVKAKTGSSRLKKALLPILIAGIFMCAIGSYYYILAEELSKLNLTYIVLSLAMFVPVIFSFIEGIYKSQGILFETKDNDLLFSLPIKKSKIVTARIIKLYVFQYLYNLLFILPAFVIYIYYETPNLLFYVISILNTFLLPIIPTIIACFIGLIIKKTSTKFKAKKVIQIVLTMLFFLSIMYFSMNTNKIMTNIINNASSINDAIMKLYYPIGTYISLIQKFDIIELLKLILINIIPSIAFVLITSKYYFNIISSSKATSISVKKNKEIKTKQRKKIVSLVDKELKKYFSSTVYMFNTLVGVIMMFIATIAICVNMSGTISAITEGEGFGISEEGLIVLMPKIFFGLIIGTACMTSITSSSISIEGKTFDIAKNLPVKTESILLSKILSSNLISIPVIIICDIIFFVVFKPTIFDIIFILLISVLMPTFTAIFGLLINLKYPKMNATSDVEVVKQSMSSMISVFCGMIIAALLIGLLIFISFKTNGNIAMIIDLSIVTFANLILWIILKKWGTRRFKEIN